MDVVPDIAIIILAIESLIVGGLLIVLILYVIQLTRILRNEVMPILHSADETVRTVRGTTVFVSENLVTPMVRASGFVSGVMQALRILARRD